MFWDDLIKHEIDFIVKYLNNNLNTVALNNLASELNSSEADINSFLERHGYILKKHSNLFEKSMYADYLIKQHPKDLTQEEIKVLKEMINLYNEKNSNIFMKIDLPKGNIKQTSIRINETVWDMFDEFTGNTDYTKNELMAMALLEFINKYS